MTDSLRTMLLHPVEDTRQGWTRRAWLARNVGVAATVAGVPHGPPGGSLLARVVRPLRRVDPAQTARLARQAECLDPSSWEALAKRAVEAAQAAGAQYADARLTRIVQHRYIIDSNSGTDTERHGYAFDGDFEIVGVGVRTLVQGYWGFAASPVRTQEEVVRLARAAVQQGREHAKGPPRTVELGRYPVMTGRWATPVKIDPFTITVEEKQDYIAYWCDVLQQHGPLSFLPASYLNFARQERVVATSDGSCFTQILYESGAHLMPGSDADGLERNWVQGVDLAAKGWELFLEAKIPEQLRHMKETLEANRVSARPGTIGRYTLVCDGKTMAKLLEKTLGLATQIDRALGYEANANGTSYIDDPLGMVGTLQVAAPIVTITANRSAPAQLATVKWDDEGVVPDEATLVRNGVLTDFQTTREQAAWLAPYYQKAGKPVRSHGYAAAEDGLSITLQHMPNLALEPAKSAVGLNDLVANVKDGMLVTDADVKTDHQARNGVLQGSFQKISNGRLGPIEVGLNAYFNTTDLWQRITAVGGPSTVGVFSRTSMDEFVSVLGKYFYEGKGQPVQMTSHSVGAAAATILNQALTRASL